MTTKPALPDIPNVADERDMLGAFLGYYRAALLDRAHGLDAEQLQITLAPSTLSIGRLISHMAWVERLWFQVRFANEAMSDPFATLDWDADSDAEMTLSDGLSVEALHELFDDACGYSDAQVAAAASMDDLSQGEPEDKTRNLRWIMIHMIEEYARHCGHADLIRESIDGDIAE